MNKIRVLMKKYLKRFLGDLFVLRSDSFSHEPRKKTLIPLFTMFRTNILSKIKFSTKNYWFKIPTGTGT